MAENLNPEVLANNIKDYLSEGHPIEEIKKGALEQGVDEHLWEQAMVILEVEKVDLHPVIKSKFGIGKILAILGSLMALIGLAVYFLFFFQTEEPPPIDTEPPPPEIVFTQFTDETEINREMQRFELYQLFPAEVPAGYELQPMDLELENLGLDANPGLFLRENDFLKPYLPQEDLTLLGRVYGAFYHHPDKSDDRLEILVLRFFSKPALDAQKPMLEAIAHSQTNSIWLFKGNLLFIVKSQDPEVLFSVVEKIKKRWSLEFLGHDMATKKSELVSKQNAEAEAQKKVEENEAQKAKLEPIEKYWLEKEEMPDKLQIAPVDDHLKSLGFTDNPKIFSAPTEFKPLLPLPLKKVKNIYSIIYKQNEIFLRINVLVFPSEADVMSSLPSNGEDLKEQKNLRYYKHINTLISFSVDQETEMALILLDTVSETIAKRLKLQAITPQELLSYNLREKQAQTMQSHQQTSPEPESPIIPEIKNPKLQFLTQLDYKYWEEKLDFTDFQDQNGNIFVTFVASDIKDQIQFSEGNLKRTADNFALIGNTILTNQFIQIQYPTQSLEKIRVIAKYPKEPQRILVYNPQTKVSEPITFTKLKSGVLSFEYTLPEDKILHFIFLK